MGRLFDRLPRGRTLPPDVWADRHRMMLWLVWLHVAGLLAFGLLQGYSPVHSGLDVVPIALFGLLAGVDRLGQRGRAACVAVALLTSSGVLVHVWGGATEAHFHFFVMVTILATYEEWSTYLMAVAFVVLHHGLGASLDPNGVFGHLDGERSPWLWAAIHGGFICALAIANVVSWRLNEEVRDAMRRSESRFRTAFDDAPIGMALVSLDGVIQRVNAPLALRTGHAASELEGMRLCDLMVDGTVDLSATSEERRFVRRDGTTGWALLQHSLLTGDDGEPDAYITHLLDISQRKQAEEQLDHQAHHDALTGLPNRTRFVHELGAALADPSPGRSAGVLFVDLDNFKLVNDSLGHGAGDRLLVAVADRIQRALRPADVVARFGGDEFAVLLTGVASVVDAERVADRIAGCLRAPVVLDGQQRFVTASIGICLAEPGTAADPAALLRDADAAMYRAKELGKARAEVFDDSLRDAVVERVTIENHLRGVVGRGELRLDYQPFIDLATGRMTGVEALLRWDHPELGVIPPLRFVPVAEQSGLIVEIGAWVLHEACRQATTWEPPIEVAVNVSPRQLADAGFPDEVASALAAAGLPADRLCLEVTESAVVADIDLATRSLERLKKVGVRLAIDDFGVGYASLSQLRVLPPVDVLKIDRSFVDGVLGDGEDRAIVDAVIQLATSLGLETVAEGVESVEQADALRTMRCITAQGYHFARPTSPASISELLTREALGELAG